MKEMLMNLVGVTKKNDGNAVLDHVWLKLPVGTVIGCTGLNRSGKTILAKVLAGIVTPDSGKFFIHDAYYADMSAAAARLREITKYLWQKTTLLDELTVFENYMLIRRTSPFRVVRKKEARAVTEALKTFGLERTVHMQMKHLSYEDKVLCEILLTAMSGTELIILEEKIETVFKREPDRVKRLLRICCAHQISFVLISKDLDMLRTLCDEIAVVRAGCIAMAAPAAELSHDQIIKIMTEGTADEHVRPAIGGEAEVGRQVLSVQGLRLFAEDSGLHLSLRRGEIKGVLSFENEWNQALFRIFTGTQSWISGEIALGTAALKPAKRHVFQSVARKLAVIPNSDWKSQLLPDLTIAQNLLLPSMGKLPLSLLHQMKTIKNFSTAHLLKNGVFSSKRDTEQDVLDVDTVTGMKLVMERVRIYHPDVLVVYELTANADIRLRETTINECKKCAAAGIGVLVISSDVSELVSLCAEVAVVKNGKVLAPCEQIDQESKDRIIKMIYHA